MVYKLILNFAIFENRFLRWETFITYRCCDIELIVVASSLHQFLVIQLIRHWDPALIRSSDPEHSAAVKLERKEHSKVNSN